MSAEAKTWKPPILTEDKLAEILTRDKLTELMAKNTERYGTILKEGKVFTEKALEMATAFSRPATKKLELARNEIAALKAELKSSKTRLSNAEAQSDQKNESIMKRGKPTTPN